MILGDLRAVPLPPRSFDVVYCAFLLERIPNAALVLDRFVATLRPGGLLLLRIRDRSCAAAVLDRSAPEPLRRALWDRLHPGEPGPFPAVYDPLTSARGIESYATAHGLVITRRESARTLPDRPVRLAAALRADPDPDRMAEPEPADRRARRAAVRDPQARGQLRPPGLMRHWLGWAGALLPVTGPARMCNADEH